MPTQTDRVTLSNDFTYAQLPGEVYDDKYMSTNFLINETSAHGSSAAVQEGFLARYNGHIVDFQIGVVTPAVSASGFVSGTAEAQPRINSVAVMSTVPSIAMAPSAGQAGRFTTFGGNQSLSAATSTLVSGVVNAASAQFSAGDMIAYDWNARSVGSAAAGAAGKGLYSVLTVRYYAL